jgi:hypothetical protein
MYKHLVSIQNYQKRLRILSHTPIPFRCFLSNSLSIKKKRTGYKKRDELLSECWFRFVLLHILHPSSRHKDKLATESTAGQTRRIIGAESLQKAEKFARWWDLFIRLSIVTWTQGSPRETIETQVLYSTPCLANRLVLRIIESVLYICKVKG